MENFDVVKILSYGLSGLAFLLLFLTYSLIRQEQSRSKPRKEILGTIRSFMFLVFFCVVVVGIFGVPTMRDNELLQASNDSLSTENQEIYSLYSFLQKINYLKNAESLDKDEAVMIVSDLSQELDSLGNSLDKVKSLKRKGIRKIQEDLAQKVEDLKKQEGDLKPKELAALAEEIQELESRMEEVTRRKYRK